MGRGVVGDEGEEVIKVGRARIYYHTVEDEKLKLHCYIHTDGRPPYVDLSFGDLDVYLDERGVGVMIEKLTEAKKELKKKEVKVKDG